MPPVVLAVVGLLNVIGITGTVGAPMLEVHGLLFPFDKPSGHLINKGESVSAGTITFQRDGVAQFVLDLVGVPIIGPDLKTTIGAVTRAWAEADGVHVEGLVRESRQSRQWLSRGGCGLCVAMDFGPGVAGQGPGEIAVTADQLKPTQVRITLPGQSGFADSWVRFVDPEIKPMPAPDKPIAMPMGGGGW